MGPSSHPMMEAPAPSPYGVPRYKLLHLPLPSTPLSSIFSFIFLFLFLLNLPLIILPLLFILPPLLILILLIPFLITPHLLLVLSLPLLILLLLLLSLPSSSLFFTSSSSSFPSSSSSFSSSLLCIPSSSFSSSSHTLTYPTPQPCTQPPPCYKFWGSQVIHRTHSRFHPGTKLFITRLNVNLQMTTNHYSHNYNVHLYTSTVLPALVLEVPALTPTPEVSIYKLVFKGFGVIVNSKCIPEI